ncbi:MAG TPA: hypothetical protein VGK19_10620 [Capsulimonadaceae bacterium]|jgi:hypothetical protein
MIGEVARMRFQSGRNPKENGALVITNDGFLQIEPSDEFVEELANLEEKAVARSRQLGIVASVVFFGIGAVLAAVAWMAGRIGGEMRHNLMRPRPIDEVEIDTNDIGSIRFEMPGSGPQKLTLEWEKGEIDECEAAKFVAVYNRFREIPPPN